MENILSYKKEATAFEEALPIGNGRLGAMVYGGTEKERLSLNEDTLWSGCGKRNPVPENAAKAYETAKQLVLEDKIFEAQEELAKSFNSMWSQMYMPLGNLYLSFAHTDTSDYLRTLDFESGICKTSYKSGGILYTREIFASHPDDVIAIKLTADKAGALNFSIECDTPLKTLENKYENNTYITVGTAPSNGCGYDFIQKDPVIYTEDKGIGFTYALKADCDGNISAHKNGIKITDATNAVLYISVKTSFNGFDKNPDTEGLDHYKNALDALSGLAYTEYDEVKQAHIKDFSSLYNRVKLNLGSVATDKDTYSRLKEFDGSDLGLYELLFGYGRYLTIAASRAGTQATNLQGIWNERISPPWSSNYTININTEMNYWHTLNTNLAECYEPFVALAKKLRKTGSLTARDYYGARGFVSHHNTDLWGMSNPVGLGRDGDACVYAFWNMSSGWICCQLYDLYEYTLDKALLKEIYPIIHDGVLFYTDIIHKDDEGYTVCPSTSPENAYLRDGKPLSVSKTTTMTVSILKELFTRFLAASEILGIENETTERAAKILPELYPIKLTADGRIMEWAYDEEEAEINHRHVSHLYSLYPGNQITEKDTPELAQACKKSLLVRGDDGTGWSLGWKINLWAYLKDGNHALKLIQRQLRLVDPTNETNYMGGGGTFPNMLDAHPPFQIDGNYGSTAAICNMLMQSEIAYIELLPALPDLWKDGSISGIVAKGNVVVDMQWKDRQVVSLTLKSKNTQSIKVCVNGEIKKVDLASDTEYKVI